MASQKFIATGLLSITARAMTSTHHVAFFLIMKALDAARRLLLEQLPVQQLVLN